MLQGGVLRFQIIIPVPDSEPALAEIKDLAVAVDHIGTDIGSEETALAAVVHLGNNIDKASLVLDSVNLIQICLDRSRTFLVKPHGIKTLLVKV